MLPNHAFSISQTFARTQSDPKFASSYQLVYRISYQVPLAAAHSCGRPGQEQSLCGAQCVLCCRLHRAKKGQDPYITRTSTVLVRAFHASKRSMPTFEVRRVPFDISQTLLDKAPESRLTEATAGIGTQPTKSISLQAWPHPDLAVFRVGRVMLPNAKWHARPACAVI